MIRWLLAGMIGLVAVTPALAQKFDGLAPTPPMGWNSWNTFASHIDEQLIRGVADVMAENGMRDAGYQYIVIDDCWLAMERDADGNLAADLKKFPGGMKALGDYLHARGFKFGIYNCAGTKTCAGFPGGHEHEEQDAKTYASWGVDYLKYDWCNTEGADPKQRYTKMRDALHAAGRPIVFSMCEWGQSKPWTWAADTAHLWRTTGDIHDVWDVSNGEPKPKWTNSVRKIVGLQVGLEKYAGPGHWNDPDMLEVGNEGLTFEESRAHFSLWCMLSAPLMAGNDVRHMSPEIRDVMTDREVIAIDQDRLGKQGYRVHADDQYEVWLKPLDGGALAACALNLANEPAEIVVDWSQLERMPTGTFKIRDLWRKADAGTTSEPFRAQVGPHDVALLRLTPTE
jgi:alpha-galactosidase